MFLRQKEEERRELMPVARCIFLAPLIIPKLNPSFEQEKKQGQVEAAFACRVMRVIIAKKLLFPPLKVNVTETQ